VAHFEWVRTDIECLGRTDLASLQDAIGQLEHHYQTRGMVICAFAINGMKFTEEDESRLSSAPFHDVRTIDVWVEPVGHLLHITLENGIKFLDGLIVTSTGVADHFRAGSRDDAFYTLRKVTEGIQILHELAAQMMHVQGFGQGELLTLQSELVTVAQVIIQGMQRKDVVVLADALEYDLPETLNHWRTQFSRTQKDLIDRSSGVEAS
jgi:hypothetical protein